METRQLDKSQLISKRIREIKRELKSHRDSLNRILNAIYDRKVDENTPYAPRKIKYSCIPISERRSEWTLKHIESSIKLLEVELETILRYSDEVSYA